jgi:hypothetical protein
MRRSRPPASASSAEVTSRRPSPTSVVKARDDVAAVSRKMEALRRLVPSDVDGGGRDEVDELLLLRAAGYIARLQAQLRVMQLMVDVLEHAQD